MSKYLQIKRFLIVADEERGVVCHLWTGFIVNYARLVVLQEMSFAVNQHIEGTMCNKFSLNVLVGEVVTRKNGHVNSPSNAVVGYSRQNGKLLLPCLARVLSILIRIDGLGREAGRVNVGEGSRCTAAFTTIGLAKKVFLNLHQICLLFDNLTLWS